MFFFKKISVKYKIIFIIFLINFLIVSIGVSTFVKNNIAQYKENALNTAILHAKLIGEHAITPLQNKNKEECQNVLSKLSFVNMVRDARLYNYEQKLMSIYKNYDDNEFFVFDFPEEGSHKINKNYILISEPIWFKYNLLGYVHLIYSTDELNKKIKDDLTISIFLALGMILFSLILAIWSQSFITEPIKHLRLYIKKIIESSNYSIRIKEEPANEFKKLYEGINLMLDKLEKRRNKHLQAEKYLRLSKEQLKKLTSSANDGIIMINSKAKIVFWNKASSLMLKYKEKEILGKDFYFILHNEVSKEIAKKAFDNMQFLIRKRTKNRIHEIKLKRKDEHIFLAEASISASYINREWNLIIIIRDITEQKKSEKELKIAKLKAEESDRLKTAFLANISHEIRTPMNAIIGIVDILNSSQIEESERKMYSNILKENSETLLQFIDDIVDISKIEASKLNINISCIPLNKNILDLINYHKKYTKNKEIQWIIDFPEKSDDFKICTDIVRFKQIFNHLIKNAIKFTDKGEIKISYTIEKNNIFKFAVKDSGIGIAEDKLKIIFERFRKVEEGFDQTYRGAGLGLTISKKATEILGGEMWVTSTIGDGSTFYFTLPNY